MKVLLFVLFAGYAVRCDDNNYYVIEMVDDPPQKPFKVYWNVPTKQCKSKKIPFDNLYQKFGIIQNNNDTFGGEKVTILYDPGLFPALLKNETSGRFKFRNGGVPQEGDLNQHLKAFNDELDQSIPDQNFDGIAIIDFESWRPVYRQNFGVLRPYKDVSLEIERKLHWWWQKKWLEAEAKKRFEEAARTFMQTTIAFAKQMRPNALWGFYGFPYCFNMASNNMVESCAANVPEENDDISWLWRESTALYPSVYSSVSLSTRQLTALIRGRVKEASRFGRRILPYFWYRYRDAGFLDPVDLNAALDTLYRSNASGFIIWGSSNDVNTVEKCTKLLNYIEQVMGPAIAKYTKSKRQDTDIDNISNNTTDGSSVTLVNRGTTNSYDVATTISPADDSINKIALDPEYHWIPPENYTQAIKDHVEEEIKNKLNNTVTKDNDTVLESNVLIDLILNSIVNTNLSHSKENTTVNVDSTYQIGEKNDLDSGELQSSTTTEATKVVEAEITPVTSIVIDDGDQNLDKTNDISSTESIMLFTTPIDDDKFIKTSQIMEYTSTTTTSISPDLFTDDVTDNISRSKNTKKSLVQDSVEGFFDVTTETSLSTESTESTPKTVVHEDSDYTTDNYKNNEENYITDVTVTKIEYIETTSKDSRGVLSTKIDEMVSSTPETTDSTQAPSQSTTLKANYKSEYDSSTTELNVQNITPENLSTKAPIFKENTKKDKLDLKENFTNVDNLSTKAPDLNGNTEVEVTKTQSEEEGTSLMPTSKSPEQVSGSAPRITKSQSLYCIIFYIYSMTKCLCSVFGQCS